MLNHDRIDVSEGMDINKTRSSKECDICHFWYILEKGFKFQPDVCSGCHDVLTMYVNLSNIAILNIYRAHYRCTIRKICKSEAINVIQNYFI